MKYEKEASFDNDIEIDASEEDIILAPPVELYEEARNIAQSNNTDEKFPFALQYDINQKGFLLSILSEAGTTVDEDDEKDHIHYTMMNMTQLAFIKRLDCIERVKTDEGSNPFLAEKAEKLRSIQEEQLKNEYSFDDGQTESIITVDDATLDVVTELEDSKVESQTDDGVAVSTVTGSTRSTCCGCTTNTSMETATEISDEGSASGYICCPGAEQWFKFTATRTGRYTILTTGSLDTIGTLYNCCGNKIIEVDDYDPCGKINFRIIRGLTEGETYYVKVRISGNKTGSYTLRVSKKVFANYVTINKSTITLEKDVLYELPITPDYTYKGYNGAKRIPGLSVSIKPSNVDEQKIWWWESSDILNCSYGWDDDGERYIHVEASEKGIAKLYAQDWNENGKRDECTVYVGGAPVTGISLDRSNKTISLHDTEELIAIVSPSNALNSNVTWKSSNWSVVDVDSNGKITGLKVGTATISATTEDGGFAAKCTVTVDAREKVTIK